MKIIDSSLCALCGEENETLIHLFCECKLVKPIWQDFQNFLRNSTNQNIIMHNDVIILGYFEKNHVARAINALIMVTKAYIFYSSQRNVVPNSVHLHHRFVTFITEQLALARIKEKQNIFFNEW